MKIPTNINIEITNNNTTNVPNISMVRCIRHLFYFKTMRLLLYKNALHSKYCLQLLATAADMNKGKANVVGLMQHQMGSSKWWAAAGGLAVMLRARTVKRQSPGRDSH